MPRSGRYREKKRPRRRHRRKTDLNPHVTSVAKLLTRDEGRRITPKVAERSVADIPVSMFVIGLFRIVDQVVAANDRVDQSRRVAVELDHPDTLDFRRLDQGVLARRDRQLVRQGHVLRGAGDLDLGDDFLCALQELLVVVSELADTVDAGRGTRLHEKVGAVRRGEKDLSASRCCRCRPSGHTQGDRRRAGQDVPACDIVHSEVP